MAGIGLNTNVKSLFKKRDAAHRSGSVLLVRRGGGIPPGSAVRGAGVRASGDPCPLDPPQVQTLEQISPLSFPPWRKRCEAWDNDGTANKEAVDAALRPLLLSLPGELPLSGPRNRRKMRKTARPAPFMDTEADGDLVAGQINQRLGIFLAERAAQFDGPPPSAARARALSQASSRAAGRCRCRLSAHLSQRRRSGARVVVWPPSAKRRISFSFRLLPGVGPDLRQPAGDVDVLGTAAHTGVAAHAGVGRGRTRAGAARNRRSLPGCPLSGLVVDGEDRECPPPAGQSMQ